MEHLNIKNITLKAEDEKIPGFFFTGNSDATFELEKR
jgi:hypothetical protein